MFKIKPKLTLCSFHNDIFSAFSNAVLMNHCSGHQIHTNCYFSQIEMNFAYLFKYKWRVESAAAVFLCCLNCEAHLELL